MAQFGRNNLFADDEEEDYEDFWKEKKRGGGGGGGGKINAFDDDAPDKLHRMRAQITRHEDGCLQSTQVGC